MPSELYVFFGAMILVINAILVINIIKTGKYSKLTYELLKKETNRIQEIDRRQKTETINKKSASKNIHDVWNKIQNENN